LQSPAPGHHQHLARPPGKEGDVRGVPDARGLEGSFRGALRP